MAGSATYKQVKQYGAVLSFKVRLFIPSWKQRQLVNLVSGKKKKKKKDLSRLIKISSQNLHSHL